jgi:DNA-directed RNA polymerase subunit RPC12/RpoP
LEEAMKEATSDRTPGVLCATCPHRRFVNQFSEFEEIDVFICDECGEPVQ